MENPNKIEIEGLKTIHKLCNFGAEHDMEGCSFTEIVERMFSKIKSMQTQVNTLDEMLLNQGDALAEAKAQTVPEVKLSRSITLTCAQLREAFMFGAPDKNDQEQLETEMTIRWSEDGHSGKGYYCYYSELPEEGAIFLDEVIKAQEPAND